MNQKITLPLPRSLDRGFTHRSPLPLAWLDSVLL
ncbi:hypothetical protein DP44_5182 [Burkholderia pseudomallei]|nr:hypothetical protein DP44_5182 [Burkholderia pseudomallei]